MGKRIEIDGKFYRWRRGKLVEIPAEWVGETLTPQTKRKRQSKPRAPGSNSRAPRHSQVAREGRADDFEDAT